MSTSTVEQQVIPFNGGIDQVVEGIETLRRQETVLNIQSQSIEEGLTKRLVRHVGVGGVTLELGDERRGRGCLLQDLELMTSGLLDVRVRVGLEKFRTEGMPGCDPSGFIFGQEGRLDSLIGVTFKQTEYESKFDVVVVVGSVADRKDLIALEDEFFG